MCDNNNSQKTGIPEVEALLSLFIYFERDRDIMSRGGAEREGEGENPKQALHCRA